MCGITGIISLTKSAIDVNALIEMNNVLSKRGPDSEGYLITNCNNLPYPSHAISKKLFVSGFSHNQNIGFGHKRLSLTDTGDAASQPMCDVTERYWIVFNGQIYNHGILRKELESHGYSFKTSHSDTEVILNSYAHWGAKCLKKLEGTWAFCLWDSKENIFFISRDRVGARPFYYTNDNNFLFFSSDLKSLLLNKSVSGEVSEKAIYDYLTFQYVPAPATIFKKIFKLPAAHYAIFKPGEEIKLVCYWNPSDFGLINGTNLTENEIIKDLRKKTLISTEECLKSDAPVGALLSGGLDSSVVLANMCQVSNSRVKTFSVGFENNNNYTNELEHAYKMAQYFNTEHTELVITEKDFFDTLPGYIALQDEPIDDAAGMALHLIAGKAGSQKVKILLGGEGSDELFVGYQHWRLIKRYEKVFRNRTALAGMFSFIHENTFLKKRGIHYQNWSYKTKKNWPVFWSGTELRTEAEKRNSISHSLANKIGNYNSFEPIKKLYENYTSFNNYETFEWMTLNDLRNRLPDQLLARLDQMLMSASIEGRYPFLSKDLMEFSFSIPHHLKIKNGIEKYLLKKAYEGILPNDVVYRKKDSFTVPLSELFKDEKRKNEYFEVIQNFNKNTGFFNESYINKLLLPENIKLFWNVLNLALWFENL